MWDLPIGIKLGDYNLGRNSGSLKFLRDLESYEYVQSMLQGAQTIDL